MTNQEKKCISNMHLPFFGCFMQQHPNAPRAINQLLLDYNFSTIIELGTHDGGLSTLLALYCYLSKMPASCKNTNEPVLYKNNTHHKTPKEFFTFDNTVRDQTSINLIEALGGKFFQYDVLTNEKCISEVGNLIRKQGRTLLLCDNGDKVKEFNIYSKFLKRGDIIMSHDFFENEQQFEQAKSEERWFSWETKLDDIKQACTDNSIINIHKEIFNECVWFCGMKM
jgi:hypothetical protein